MHHVPKSAPPLGRGEQQSEEASKESKQEQSEQGKKLSEAGKG